MDYYKNIKEKKNFQRTLKVEIDIKTKMRGYPTKQLLKGSYFVY